MDLTTREADETWGAFIRANVDVAKKRIADIGCGGGIYTKALASMGASHVVGVDFSEEMLRGAAEHCKDIPNVTFRKGVAYQTGLPANEVDIVLERALIHHLSDLEDDEELQELVSFIADKLETTPPPIVEKDAWTVRLSRKK